MTSLEEADKIVAERLHKLTALMKAITQSDDVEVAGGAFQAFAEDVDTQVCDSGLLLALIGMSLGLDDDNINDALTAGNGEPNPSLAAFLTAAFEDCMINFLSAPKKSDDTPKFELSSSFVSEVFH